MRDLWVVTSYFNPSGFKTKRQNYDLFIDGLRAAGVPCLTVECTFGETPFELLDSDETLRVRAPSILWLKERLLNLGIAALPRDCTKVAWLDCDVLFDSPDWARDTSTLLDDEVVVQPFTSAVRLPRGTTEDNGEGERSRSFADVLKRDPKSARAADFDIHGHTGFAWAARRDFLSAIGLYDVCLSGSADHLMAHAFANHLDNGCVTRRIGKRGRYRDHFMQWAERARNHTRGRIGATPGNLRHLWHGDDSNRKYKRRYRELHAAGFDPGRDLRLGAHGCWEWSAVDPPLRKWMQTYFSARREDG